MKALVLHRPGHCTIEDDWPTPTVKPGWARVRVHYAGICGSDLPRFVATGSYHHPMILGHEFAGVVDVPAPDPSRYRGGERVAILPIIPCGECPACRQNEPFHCAHYQFLGSRNDGGFAEYCLVPEQNLFPLPEGVDLRYGALIEPLCVGLHVARRTGLAAGDSALVFGAGPIGLLTALWLRAFGARRVVVADVRPESLDLAGRMGFADVVNPAQAGWHKSLPAFDVTIEAAGNIAALLAGIERTRDKGTITVVGRDTKDTVVPLASFERLMRKEITLCGCWGYNTFGEEAYLRHMLAQGILPLAPLITHEISLDEAPAMIRAMADRSLHYGKVMIGL